MNLKNEGIDIEVSSCIFKSVAGVDGDCMAASVAGFSSKDPSLPQVDDNGCSGGGRMLKLATAGEDEK
uniref:Uncharacterized protein n=1 Tax=Romanomermis culicivorax TaxID=13658 RepID=A0A915KCX0_ROMCU